LLLEGAETYGLGSWAEIADHIGGFRTKEEVRDHYISTYVESPNFPLPARADPRDLSLLEKIPREEFQARKKRRIEERKEAAKNATPSAPKQKPTTSVPSCHEVQGYMPGRLEFETEYANEAEEYVQHMQFDPGEGYDPVTHSLDVPLDPETELKMVVMDVYNQRLTQRANRKKVIFEHNLLEYRKNNAMDKKKTKEERDLLNRVKPFSRMCNHKDFIDFSQGIEYEHNLRQAIAQLQDWRAHRLLDLQAGEQYETEKASRLARPPPTGQFDRMGGVRSGKPPVPVETPSATVALTAPDLPERLKSSLRPSGTPTAASKVRLPLMDSSVNSNLPRAVYSTPAIAGLTPLELTLDNAPDLHLLNPEERELCSVCKLQPKPYLVIKEALLREAVKNGGGLKRKDAKAVCKVSCALFA
jgi:transcriptional adapter 2-alpha